MRARRCGVKRVCVCVCVCHTCVCVSVCVYLCDRIFLFSYIIVNNVDYRLVFLCVALILDSQHVLIRTGLFKIYQVLILTSLYLVYPWAYSELIPGVPIQVLGDIALHIVAMFCLARVYCLLLRFNKDRKLDQKTYK